MLHCPLLQIFPDDLTPSQSDSLDAMLPESADEVVDSSVGMGRNEDRVRNLPVMFEEFDGLDDNAGLAGSRWLNVSCS